MVLGSGASGRRLSHERDQGLFEGWRDQSSLFSPHEDTMRNQQSATRKQVLLRTCPCWRPDLRLPIPRTELRERHFCCLHATQSSVLRCITPDWDTSEVLLGPGCQFWGCVLCFSSVRSYILPNGPMDTDKQGSVRFLLRCFRKHAAPRWV